MLDITAIILTYNEEIHIRRCLENVKQFAKRIIVVDCFSTSNPQPPSKNDIELKEKEATQKKRLKEVKIATRRHKIPLPHNAT